MVLSFPGADRSIRMDALRDEILDIEIGCYIGYWIFRVGYWILKSAVMLGIGYFVLDIGY